MKLLDFIDIAKMPLKRIELLQGDLSDIPPQFAIDLLIVSAVPGVYVPTPSSLIGALHRKGLNVSTLEATNQLDLRDDFSCWLSQKFVHSNSGLRFNRVLCFEPNIRGHPAEFVGDIFRALTPILAENPDINTLAMPVLSTGNQRRSISSMLTPLLEASIHWMEKGLPLQCIRIVVYSDDEAKKAKRIFSSVKANIVPIKPALAWPAPAWPASEIGADYDVFISYAHKNTADMETLERSLLRAKPSLRIFLDRKEIDVGAAWQSAIFESLDRCRKIVTMFSPDYLKSNVCKEEYNIAWLRSVETSQNIIFPVYVHTANLPTYMKTRNYFDCREGDKLKLEQASDRIITSLGLNS